MSGVSFKRIVFFETHNTPEHHSFLFTYIRPLNGFPKYYFVEAGEESDNFCGNNTDDFIICQYKYNIAWYLLLYTPIHQPLIGIVLGINLL